MRRLAAVLFAGCGFNASSAVTDAPGGSNAPMVDARASDAGSGSGSGSGSGAGSGSSESSQITYVQSSWGEDQSKPSQTVALPKPQRAGDLNIVAVGWYKTGTITSISDTQHNTYQLAIGPTMSPTGTEYQSIYYACSIAGGSNSVTVAFADDNQDPEVRVAEYSGASPSGCYDASAASTGGGSALDAGPVTASEGELLVAADKVYYLTSASDPSYAQRLESDFGDIVEDRTATAAGSFHATATENMAGGWVMQLATFR